VAIHPNAISVWTTIEVAKDSLRKVLVVETDLKLNAKDPAYDKAKVDSLTGTLIKYFDDQRDGLDLISIRSIKQDTDA
jgi:hypothetical protein